MLSGYISKSACNGRRPIALASRRGRQRPALIARLLKERTVARFIVAPFGYGKTFLALEYAETVFSWEHVFWLNAQSPCFLRDLDLDIMVEACLQQDPDARLVVIDDAPLLDAQRAQRLSDVIDALLEARIEVVVTCTPLCDAVARLQMDCIRLGSDDLLLDDEELDVMRPADERMRTASQTIAAPQRVVGLAWADSSDARLQFVKGSFDDEMPADLMLAMAASLIVQRGAVSDIVRFVGSDRVDVVQMLESYPHIGFDEDFDRFESAFFPVKDIASAIKPHVQLIVVASRFTDRTELSEELAAVLMQQRNPERACHVIEALTPSGRRMQWLVSHAYDLVELGCFQPSLSMTLPTKEGRSDKKERYTAFRSLCLRLLGDEAQAVLCAKPYAFDRSVPYDARVCCLLVLVRNAAPTVVEHAFEELRELADMTPPDGIAHGDMWRFLARGWIATSEGAGGFAQFWHETNLEGADSATLCILASWLFGLINDAVDDVWGGESAELGESQSMRSLPACHAEAERYVRARMEEYVADGFDFFTASAGLSLERAHGRGLVYEAGALPTSVLVCLRNAEVSVLAQRTAYEREQRSTRVKRKNWESTHPDASLTIPSTSVASSELLSVPTLKVRLFGRFVVEIGGVPVSDKLFNRKNVQVLLVLLAANQGRELSRELVAQTMWPHSTSEVAKKNFYTVWAQLRKALMLPDGTCPYLVRRQYSCSLEERFIESDVSRFMEICRELSFGKPDPHTWAALYYEIDRDFASDLMPSERKNELILQAREECRTRLIDSLITASGAILEAGDTQWGMWYARAAIKRDKTREDAYIALMRAQYAAHQRTAAMTTYLKCRRVLSEELGVDPSPELAEFYERLLEAGMDVD